MKTLTTRTVLILLVTFTIQAATLRFPSTQELLYNDYDSENYFGRVGYSSLLDISVDQDNPTQTVANIFAYYVQGRTFSNVVYSMFARADTTHQGQLSLHQYYNLTSSQGISLRDAERVLKSIQGTPDACSVDVVDFQNIAEILLLESISMTTFTYLMKGPKYSENDLIDYDTLEAGILRIFSHLEERLFPKPGCTELRYLFGQADKNNDQGLNIQEFYVFLSVYLRYYKYGLKNNYFAAIITEDKLFEAFWESERESQKTATLRKAFIRFFQISVYDDLLYQSSHALFQKFDKDNNDAISFKEFEQVMRIFDVSCERVAELFNSTTLNHCGEIEFAEFVLFIENLFNNLTADFGHNLITSTSAPLNLKAVTKIFEDALISLGLEKICAEKYKELFHAVDSDCDGILNREEFSKLVTEIICLVRESIPRHTCLVNRSPIAPLPEPSSEAVQIQEPVKISDIVPEERLVTRFEREVQECPVTVEPEPECPVTIEPEPECGCSHRQEPKESECKCSHSQASKNPECECSHPQAKEPECLIHEEPECPIVEEPECQIPEEPECPIVEEPECPVPEEPECPIVEEPECSVPEEPECLIVEEPECTIPEPEPPVCEDVSSGVQDAIKQKIIQIGTQAVISQEVHHKIERVVTEKVVEAGIEAVIHQEISKVIEEETCMTLQAISELVEQTTGVTMAAQELVHVVRDAARGSTEKETIEKVKDMSSDEIIQSITGAVAAIEPPEPPKEEPPKEEPPQEEPHEEAPPVTPVVEEPPVPETDYKGIIQTVEDVTGLTGSEIVQDVRKATQEIETGENNGELSGVSDGDAVEALAETVTNEEVSKAIEEVTGMTTEEIAQAVKEITGEVIESFEVVEAVKAATGKTTTQEIVETVKKMTNSQVVEAVAQAVLCKEAMEQQAQDVDVTSDRAVDIIFTVSDTTGLPVDDVVEDLGKTNQIEQVVEALENSSEDEAAKVVTQVVVDEEVSEAIEQSTGLTVEEVANTVKESTNVEVTESDIVKAVETASQGHTPEEIIEGVQEMDKEQVLEAITEGVSGGESRSSVTSSFLEKRYEVDDGYFGY